MNTMHPIPKGRVQVKLDTCSRPSVLVLKPEFSDTHWRCGISWGRLRSLMDVDAETSS